MVVAANGDIYVGGAFADIGGDATMDGVAYYDVSAAAWVAMDGGVQGDCYALAFAPDGTLYLGGVFVTVGSAATTVNYIARWNGASYEGLDSGMNNSVYYLSISSDGTVYASGNFTEVGSKPLITASSAAAWNGWSWVHIDIDFPTVPLALPVVRVDYRDYVFVGTSGVGTARHSGQTVVANLGSALAYPNIEIKNFGVIELIGNETTGHGIWSDLLLFDGEILTIDLDPGDKTVTSSWRGNMLGEIMPRSDLGTFKLESYPRANHGAVNGGNLVSVFITDGIPVEITDANNELSEWEAITGINYNNTTQGSLYASVLNVGGPPWRVNLYRDVARGAGDLVGHTANYAATGIQPILVDNASGLGGYIRIDALGPADATIEAHYTIANPRKFNDAAWQLTGFDNITGISQDNTDFGKLYVTVVDDGAGANWHVDLYMDAARGAADLVGHTASYAAAYTGVMAVQPDNASGLGGTITIAFPAAAVADADIEVIYTIVTATWHNRWWSVDEAVLAAEG